MLYGLSGNLLQGEETYPFFSPPPSHGLKCGYVDMDMMTGKQLLGKLFSRIFHRTYYQNT